jgi:hypothetical protein
MGAPFTTPSLQELERRREFYKSMEALRISHTANSEGSACFPTVEEMIREDRDR